MLYNYATIQPIIEIDELKLSLLYYLADIRKASGLSFISNQLQHTAKQQSSY
jgi:hypothetical protein